MTCAHCQRAVQQEIASTDDNPERFEQLGVELVRGHARLAGPHTVDVGGRRLETRFVTGRSVSHGGGGDPSVNTAYGVLQGLRAVAEELWKDTDLAGRHVVVQGVGKVGSHLCHLLHEAGARLTVADVDLDNVARAVKEYGADTVEPAKAHAVECDIFHRAKAEGIPTSQAADRAATDRMREVSRLRLIRVGSRG